MDQAIFKPRQIILVTGAARSGKSEWAETLAQQMNQPIIYVATAQTDETDLDWQRRIERHRLRRPSHWQTLSIPTELVPIINQTVPPSCLLVDSLGTWVANLLDYSETAWEEVSSQLRHSLAQSAVDVILVAEETGWGVIPAYPLGRQFRDRLGHLIRQIGAIADIVYLVTGGHVLNLSLLGQPLQSISDS